LLTELPLLEYQRIAARIAEGESKRNKRDNLGQLLLNKINSVKYPMQELELNYPTTKGKVYSEEEDRYLLVRLNHYGMQQEDVYERIKKDITEFPVFRFDWFFKSRSPQELQRRCNTLLGMIEKEAEQKKEEEAKAKGSRSKVRALIPKLSRSTILTVIPEAWSGGAQSQRQEGEGGVEVIYPEHSVCL
jgi:SWI/SNF-related matrix-associated actin-dependent regulator of chromatin subfamily A member 5